MSWLQMQISPIKSANFSKSTDTGGELNLYTGIDRIIVGIKINEANHLPAQPYLYGGNNTWYCPIFKKYPDTSGNLYMVLEKSQALTGTYYYIDA